MCDFSHDEHSTVSTSTPCVGLHWRLLYVYSCIDLPANASLKDRVVTYMQFRTADLPRLKSVTHFAVAYLVAGH